jgi:hypothetical protein
MLVLFLAFAASSLAQAATETDWHTAFQGTNTQGTCCKVCTTGKPCGNTCIAVRDTCYAGPGCACKSDGAQEGLLKTFAPSLSTQTRALPTAP